MKILFENEIALVLIVKNESPYIEEWLEYHYKIGVDKFYIYDNDSDDREELQKILAPWIESKIVEYTEFPGTIVQMTSYVDAVKKHRFDCRYLGIIDADEFIVPKQNLELIDILDATFHMPPPPSFNCCSRNQLADVRIKWTRSQVRWGSHRAFHSSCPR